MVQSITEILQQRQEHRTQQVLLLALQQKSKELVSTYGNRESFLTTFNPDVQREICGNTDVCFFGGAPTLTLLNNAYGEKTAAMWLVPQLYNLSEYCGCRDKLSANQLKECASVIATEFAFLSVTELMLFFHRFKAARYGRFYGTVDPLIITESLRKFLGERIAEYDRHEKEEKERREAEEAKNTISWEEYSMKKYGEVRPHPLCRNLKKPDDVLTEEERKKNEEARMQLIARTVKFAKSIITDTLSDDETKAIFARQFKRHLGMTPQEFLDKYDK